MKELEKEKEREMEAQRQQEKADDVQAGLNAGSNQVCRSFVAYHDARLDLCFQLSHGQAWLNSELYLFTRRGIVLSGPCNQASSNNKHTQSGIVPMTCFSQCCKNTLGCGQASRCSKACSGDLLAVTPVGM